MYPSEVTAKSNSPGIVTISFFKYKGVNKIWAFKEMQMAKEPISETPGLSFFKLMGSGGGNGFGLKPDFSVYALLAVWKNRNYARNFHKTSKVFRNFKNHSEHWWTVYMTSTKSKGSWDKENPFLPVSSDNGYEGPIAVITRASISIKHLRSFWNNVPQVSNILKDQKGLLFSKGIGEYPILQQATFSIWESRSAMVKYAYSSEEHKDVIDKTRSNGWYSEDLFAEFKIIDSDGKWEGIELENISQRVQKDVLSPSYVDAGNAE